MELIIGICDDCKEQIELVENYLLEFRKSFKINIISSTEPFKFFHKLDEYRPDLVFLDIDMDELDGIKLGERIKKEYSNTIIIYITAYEKYALEAFRVRAFHYLLKPITAEKFSQVFREAISLLKKDYTDNRYYTVKKKGEYISLNYEKIYYFEKVRHRVKLCTLEGDISFYGTFKKLLHEIDMDFFIRCHQGYIVNKNKIRAYRDQMLFLDEKQKKIPVSRSHIKEVKEMMENRLFD
ncbi:MAG TPA: LytTR family DNA-binding domain-containing protein [Halanaerobiales bacterium]|nr:LytTR family DNA-binding domain-containing protein [Halanaerobiales bacterium]